MFYDFEKFQMLNKNNSSHDEIIIFLRQFKDIKKKRDKAASISNIDCVVKLWKFKNPLLSSILDLGYIYNNGFFKVGCFISYNSILFLSVMNYENANREDNIKLINIESKEIYIFENTA